MGIHACPAIALAGQLEHFPPAGSAPDLDGYPGVRELRHRMESDAARLQRWRDGFESLVAVCDCKAVAAMSELLAFWLDSGFSSVAPARLPRWFRDAARIPTAGILSVLTPWRGAPPRTGSTNDASTDR
jgi:hypothetical protein